MYPFLSFPLYGTFIRLRIKKLKTMLDWEKAKILSAVMRTRALEERTRPFVEEFDNAGEWELALASVIGDFVKQKVTFPYDVAVLADHEFMPDDLVESMWTYATEEFDYEAHLDLLER
ncbi:hypothetical protein HMPREF2710_05940 [Rothia sp. HMSC069D01]|jgi:hypothetical protein|nr:hypothetical protein HMPREF2710_05940 [Rothia sp. HMSC069D01]